PSSLSDTTGVVFRGERYTTIPARRLDVASARDDLAVLELDPPPALILPHAPMVLAAQLRRGTWVWNIGIGQNWDMPDRAGGLGPWDAVNGLRRIGALRTPPGTSGGAGVTDSGVIGIVLQDATDYSLLLPIERIVELFQAWDLPVNLLTSSGVASSGAVSPPESALLQQREDANDLFETSFLRYKECTIDLREVINGDAQLLEAELSVSSDRRARVAAYEASLKRARELQTLADKKFEQGTESQVEISKMKLHRTQIEIGLAKERGAVSAP